MALYLCGWRRSVGRGEASYALQVCDVDLDKGILHIAFNYVVVDGCRVRKDTKTHQDRYLAIDPVTCAMIGEHLDAVRARLADVGVERAEDAYVFSNDPAGATPWNPDWASHKASDLAATAGVKLNIKGLRDYTASQLLAAQFDLRNTAARLGHGSGGAATLRHYADPVSEVDRRAAAYLAQLTAGPQPMAADVPSWSAPASLEAAMSANRLRVYQMPVLYSRFPRTFSAAYHRSMNEAGPRYTTAPSPP
jgi:integrase